MSKIGHFGRLVIGDAAAEAEAKVVEKGAIKYGPLVLDDPADEPQEAPEAPSATTEAPKGEIAPEKAAEDADADQNGYTSVAEVRKAVSANPEAVDALFRAEITREGGPRKSAVVAMIAGEQKRAGGPRPEVLEALAHAAKAAGGAE